MSHDSAETPFQFETGTDEAEALPVSAAAPVAEAAGDEHGRLRRAIEAVGEAVYHWKIESDEIVWSVNAEEVLGCKAEAVATGRAFAAFLDPDNFTSRYDTVMRTALMDDGEGIPFQIEYKFRPEGRLNRTSLWLEDHGRWYGGSDGRPVEVFGVIRRIDDRHRRDQHLSFLGNCDPLTGMMNRGRMTEALGEAMSVAHRDGTSCAFVIAAINNLSVVNEAYGFEVADEVIVNMGRRLRSVVRGGDAIARYSGSKFGLILNNCSESDLAVAVERFLGVARESVIETAHGPVWSLFSIGAIVLPAHAGDPNTAMAHAEEALAEARRLPTDGYAIYQPSEERAAARRYNAKSATDIVRCLRENLFKIAYQPVISAKTGETSFHEALLRMAGADGKVIGAAHLVPIAEKLGLVRLIDRAVVQMAITALHAHPDVHLSLNLSATTATDPRWYPQITSALASNEAVTSRLIIEITETVALADLKETTRFVEELRKLGCRVAIDDFGAGHTSFRTLRNLPVDILKLDGTFCRDLARNADNRYFVRSLIDMARTFGLKTVAEWVETEEDARLLREWEIDFMQGHFFGDAVLDPPWTADPATRSFMAPEQSAAARILTPAAPAPALPQIEPAPLPAPAAARPPEPVVDPVAAFEQSLPDELAKLRAAIAALDQTFNRKKPQPGPEPSYADLLSDSLGRAAG